MDGDPIALLAVYGSSQSCESNSVVHDVAIEGAILYERGSAADPPGPSLFLSPILLEPAQLEALRRIKKMASGLESVIVNRADADACVNHDWALKRDP